MGKTLSTQLRICNHTSGSISMSVSDTKPSRWVEPNTPHFNFHSAVVVPNSDYSRELTINGKRRAHCFTLTLTFNDAAKILVFRFDQGQTVDSARNRLPHKEKHFFEMTGDVTAYEVKHSVSGNTMTIDIRDSYMYNPVAYIKKTSQISESGDRKDPKILSVLRELLIKDEEEKERASELESEGNEASSGDVEKVRDDEETVVERNGNEDEKLEEVEVSVTLEEEGLQVDDEELAQELKHADDRKGEVDDLLEEEERILHLLQQEQLSDNETHDILELAQKAEVQEQHIQSIEQQIKLLEQQMVLESQQIQVIELKNEINEQDSQLEEYIQQILKDNQENIIEVQTQHRIQVKEVKLVPDEEIQVEERHTKESSPLKNSEPQLQVEKERPQEQQVSLEDSQQEVQLRIKVSPGSPLLSLQESHF